MRWAGGWQCVAALGLGLIAGAVAGCGDERPPYVVDVGAPHRFHAGDDARAAAPDFDDSSWTAVSLPAVWRRTTIRPDVFGWHRFRFELPDPAPAGGLALDLGSVGWSDEVFLNGRLIGATGRMDGAPRLGLRARLYPVPDGVLRPGTNVLAIRVRGIPFGVAGLFTSRIGIGGEAALTRARADASSKTQLVEGMFAGFFVFAWLLVAFFPKRGRAGRATLFLLGAISTGLVVLWLVGSTYRRNGLSPEVGANVVFAVGHAASAFYFGFVAIVTRGMLPRPIKAVIVGHGVLGLMSLVWADSMGLSLVVGAVVSVGGLAGMWWLLVGAIKARTPGAIPIAVGCVLPALSIVSMLVFSSPFIAGLPMLQYGLASAFAFAVLALTRHVHAMNRRVQQATDYALEAHTRERTRLARDLHDGLGQMLALLKMQMQRMGRKHEGEAVREVFVESADQVGATLDELRRIARDLRPAPMQDRAFGEAVREYAAAIARRTELEVVVEGDFSDSLSEEMGDELYRITQECLTNCLKHSEASKVVVTLSETGDRYGLTVVDDGRGLSDEDQPGLGLTTIRERSEILGGKCTITTVAGRGTRIEVNLPR